VKRLRIFFAKNLIFYVFGKCNHEFSSLHLFTFHFLYFARSLSKYLFLFWLKITFSWKKKLTVRTHILAASFAVEILRSNLAATFSSGIFAGLWQTASGQGCQMVYFQTKNPNLGRFWRALDWKKGYISWPFGVV
jgi:hypothetical protein